MANIKIEGNNELSLKVIARMRTDFPEKFGIPRQSGLVDSLSGMIVFEPDFRIAEALKGLDKFSHIWIIWGFSKASREDFSPTVRPPRLGGNTRMGVFSTRSPFRPNPLALSSVKLDSVGIHPDYGTVLYVSGIDIMDNSPIYDIKPYIAYTDCHTDATCGFVDSIENALLEVCFPGDLLSKLPDQKRESAISVLAHDPRPRYIGDTEREYGLSFAGFNIRFKVDGSLLSVLSVEETNS